MKKLYSLFIVLFAAIAGSSSMAQTTCLTLNFTTGDVVKFALNEKPVMTFGESDVTIVTDYGLSASYLRSGIKDFNFTQGTTSAITEAGTDGQLSVDLTNPDVMIIKSAVLGNVKVYNTAGQLSATAEPTDGVATVNLGQLPKGVYVVAIEGHNSFKIKK